MCATPIVTSTTPKSIAVTVVPMVATSSTDKIKKDTPAIVAHQKKLAGATGEPKYIIGLAHAKYI